MDYKEFVNKDKSMLIAPAGYGKTYTIAECLKYIEGKCLILTHTHAGISALKQKISTVGISSKKYQIETITGYAQKYVQSFYYGNDNPEQENTKEYYPFIIKKATELLQLAPISKVVSLTYSGVIIDEYQDCNLSQHEFMMTLAKIIPTTILGDYLQGIFDFTGEGLVDLNSKEVMLDFFNHKYELSEPKRWEKTNVKLGEDLKEIRRLIEAKEEIELSNYKSIESHTFDEKDLYTSGKPYNKLLWDLKGETNLLVIHPNSTSPIPRKKIVATFGNTLTLVEAIDDKDFYNISYSIDKLTVANFENEIRDILHEIFNSELSTWFNKKGLINKKDPKDKLITNSLKEVIDKYKVKPSLKFVSDFIQIIKGIPNVKTYRKELLYSILKALDNAHYNSTSVNEGMRSFRNQIRRNGRKIHGRCIGTTLLTKGLEFDTVIILDAHKFEAPKHLYVALTRASKRLIVVSSKSKLSPNY